MGVQAEVGQVIALEPAAPDLRPMAMRLAEWRADPVRFVRDLWGVEADAWQTRVLRDFASPDPACRRIAMSSCAGPGKTAVLAWCGWNFLLCYGSQGSHPNGACLSVTRENLRDHLWKELAVWRVKARDNLLSGLFEQTHERIYARNHPETWWLSARSYPKDADTETLGRTLSGLHAPYVLILIDESGSIPVEVLKAADQAMSSAKWCKIMQAGNPLALDGMLYATATRLKTSWRYYRVTADPDDPERTPRVPIDLAREQIAANGGRDDPWVRIYVLGEFPHQALNSLLSVAEVDRAMVRAPRVHDFDAMPRILGVDVARDGLDSSCIAKRQGVMVYPLEVLRGHNSTEGAGKVARRWQDWKADAGFIDNTGGFGAGWLDQLHTMGCDITGVEFAGRATDPRYGNKRSEMWHLMAEAIKAGCALPQDASLSAELTEVRYFHRGDQLMLEPKDEVRKRLGRSPDRADSVALTWAFPVAAPRSGGGTRRAPPKARTDRDPYYEP